MISQEARPGPEDIGLVSRPSVTSTNAAIRALVDENQFRGGFGALMADVQTEGRGRRGRTWISPKGNLYLTLAYRSQRPPQDLALLSLAAALAWHEVLRTELPEPEALKLKWPNDILYQGAKLAGILLELHRDATQGDVYWLLIGTGLNIEWHPQTRDYVTTSLAAHLHVLPEREALARRYAWHFLQNTLRWEAEGNRLLRETWLHHSLHRPGDALVARLPDQEVRGAFRGLNLDGSLKLELESGEVRAIQAADVFFDAAETRVQD